MKPGLAFSANTAVEHSKDKDFQCHAAPDSNYPLQINTDMCVKQPFAWTGSPYGKCIYEKKKKKKN